MKRVIIILSFILLAIVYLPLFVSGQRAANDLPYTSQDVLSAGASLPQAWSVRGGNSLGENIVFTLWSWPIDFLFGLGGRIGVSFSTLLKVIFLLPITLISFFSIYKFLEYIGIKNETKYVGVLVYLLNTYLLLLIDGGQLSIALAYSIFPLSYLLFIKATSGDFKEKLKAALGFSLLIVCDIRFAYMLAVVLAFKFIFDVIFAARKDIKLLFRNWFITSIVILFVSMALNIYWILPLMFSPKDNLPSYLASVDQLSFLNLSNLFNGLLLQQPHWPLNSFGAIAVPKAQFIFFLIASIFLIFKKNLEKNELFFLFTFLIFAFLSKGSNAPFGFIYTFLFQHLPGFFFFRDSTKFLTIVALSMSVLIPSSISYFQEKIAFSKKIPSLIFILYIAFVVSPVWMGKMTGIFSPQPFSKEYERIAENIGNDNGFGRILWIPSRPPLGYSSMLHPALDGFGLASKRPFSTANIGNYERFNFLRESRYSGELLNISGISYIAYPFFDERKVNVSSDDRNYYNSFSEQLSKTNWVGEKVSSYPVSVYKTKKQTDQFWTTSNLWWVLGNENIYDNLFELSDFNLKDNPLIFVEDFKGALTRFSQLNYGKILVYRKNETDILGGFVEKDNYLNISDVFKSKISGNGWLVDINNTQNWREFLHDKYTLDNVDFGEAQDALVVEGGGEYLVDKKFIQNNTLLLRVLFSSSGGTIEVSQNEVLFDIKTLSENLGSRSWGIDDGVSKKKEYGNAEFHWIAVNNIKKDLPIKLTIKGKINSISAIASMDSGKISSIEENIDQMEKEGKIVQLEKLDLIQRENLFKDKLMDDSSWERIAQTSYKVSSNNKEKKLLVFSESYSPLWKIGDTESLPLYSLINGFVVSGNEYEIDYMPQKYIHASLVVFEAILLLFLLGYIFRKSKNEK